MAPAKRLLMLTFRGHRSDFSLPWDVEGKDTWWKHGGSGVVTWIRMDANGRSNNSWFINDVAADGTYILDHKDLSSLADKCYQSDRMLVDLETFGYTEMRILK